MLYRPLTILIFLLFSTVGLCSSGERHTSVSDAIINEFFKKLYDFSFDEADSLSGVLSNSDIDGLTVLNIRANLAWWKILSGDSVEDNLKKCNNYLIQVISIKPDASFRNPDTLFNIIYAYSLKARIENYSGNTIKSLVSFYRSVSFIEKYIEISERDEKQKLLTGLYYYLIDFFEKENKVLGIIFFPPALGNMERGLMYLEECAVSKDEMIRTEANYFLMKIHASTQKDYFKALNNARVLTSEHPDNFVFNLEHLRLMQLANRSAEASIMSNKLLSEVRIDGKLNNVQKAHFISQIDKITGNSKNKF
jgi:hypothetical protein